VPCCTANGTDGKAGAPVQPAISMSSPAGLALRDGLVLALGKLAPAAALCGLAPIYDWHPPVSS
jgi:hypothetical protein